MKITGDYTFAAPLPEIWKALLDPAVLAASMPGCEKLERVGEQYVGELNVKIGPVQGKFIGKIDLLDVVEHEAYTIKVDGRGAPGFVNATGHVQLEPADTGTKLSYAADASVGGKMASVGQRLIEASARAIIKQSLEGMNAMVQVRMAALGPAAIQNPGSPVADTGESADAEPKHAAEPLRLPPMDQTKFASAVAKDVGKALLPRVAMWTLAAIVVVCLLRLLVLRLR